MLDDAHHATLLCSRSAATFAPLKQPGEKMVVCSWDATDVAICHSSNQALQKRTYSTKSNSNAFHRCIINHKSTHMLFLCFICSEWSVQTWQGFLSAVWSSQPQSLPGVLTSPSAGTSVMMMRPSDSRVLSPAFSPDFLATAWSIFLTVDSCNIISVKVCWKIIIILTRKFGFDRVQRQSFKEWLEALQLQHPNVHFFFPSGSNEDFVLDSQLQPVGQVNAHGLTKRQVSLSTHLSNIKY